MAERLVDAFGEPVPPPTQARIASIRAAAVAARAATGSGDGRSGRRALLVGVAAASVAGVAGTVVGRSTASDTDAIAGPPTEPLRWTDGSGRIPGSTISGSTINHTWGVELLLDTTGLVVGEHYRVRFLSTVGEPVDAGGFVGAELPIHCRCNGPLLRPDVAAIEIIDPSDRLVASGGFA